MKKNVKIIYLEDNKNEVELLDNFLNEHQYKFELKSVSNREEYLNLINKFNPDIVLADYEIPGYSGLDAITDLQVIQPNTPIIILTGSISEETAVNSMLEGAWDYVIKDRMFRLIPSIENAIKRSEVEKQLQKEKQEAQDTLVKSEERYRTFVQQSNEGIFRFELKELVPIDLPADEQIKKYYEVTVLEECNDKMAHMYGLSGADELVGASLEDFLPYNAPGSQDYFKRFIKNNFRITNNESVEIDKDGNEKIFLNNLIGIIENNNLVRVWGVQRDVTEYKKTSLALKESEEKFKSLFDNSIVGIYRTSIEGEIIMANPTLIKMLGYKTFDELKERNINQTGYKNSDERKNFISKFENTDEVKGLEYEWLTKDGKVIFIRENAKAIKDDEGNIKYFEGSVEDITKRKKYENELVESEKRFKVMADTAPVMIWMAGSDKLSFYFNKPWLNFTGRTLDDELGHGWLENIHPSDLEFCLDTYNDAFHNKQEFKIEYRIKRYDGIYRWIIDHGTPRTLPDGTFAGFIGSCVDITDRKQTEENLKESEELYRTVVQSLNEGLLITDKDERIIFANKRMEDIYGYSVNEMLGKYSYKLFCEPANWKKVLENSRERFEGKSNEYEIEQRTKDGRKIWVSVIGAPYKNSKGEVIGTIGAINDITEIKEYNLALIRSEEKYRSVVENAREVILQTDAEGNLTFLNPYWEEMTGFSIDESLGKAFIKFVHPYDRQKSINEFTSMITNHAENVRLEVRCVTKDNNFKWIEVNARIDFDEHDNILGTFATINDIHDRKIAENALIKAKERAEESDRLKSNFIAQVSHEIRTPLNIILSYNNLIKDEVERLDQLREIQDCFNSIDNAGKRLMRTIDLILNMSIIQTGEIDLNFKDINVENLINNLITEFSRIANENNLQLNFSNEAENPVINGDEYTLLQAFENLIDNAIKYTPNGKVDVSISRNNSRLKVSVKDTGIGISNEFLPKLFDPFSQEESGYTRKFDGNGLGLSLTKKYIELNNAVLTVNSEKGKGTEFAVIF